jgi:hypothetical protein
LSPACVPTATNHLTNIFVNVVTQPCKMFHNNLKPPSTFVKNINHIMHLVFHIWWKLQISVEFRQKPENIRIALLKCNVKKVVIFITGFIAIYFRDKLMWLSFSQFVFLWKHSQLNGRYISISFRAFLFGARKRYKLQTVLAQ